MRVPINGLYAIIDPDFLPNRTPVGLAKELLAGGCRTIQLRVKGDPGDQAVNLRRLDAAREIMALKWDYEFTFIVNDDAVLARELQTDGVHLGANDMPVAEARSLLRDGSFIGYSSHGLSEAQSAQQAGADYVAFGAIFPSATKGADHPIQGTAKLSEVVRSLQVPVVAIGGMTRDNVVSAWETGVAAIAMITSLSKVPNPRAETSWFVQKLRR